MSLSSQISVASGLISAARYDEAQEVALALFAGAAGFEKLVAIKRIHPHHAADGGFGSMLLDEAKLSVALSHRNIVQTLDLACVGGAYVLVMEHVEGYDAHHVLETLRRAGRLLPVDLAAHVIAEVCRGLDARSVATTSVRSKGCIETVWPT